jgi:hypothetical protein
VEDKQGKKLTKAQEVFIDEYLKCFNATDAYSAAYPKANRNSAQAAGSRLLSNVMDSDYYRERLAQVHASDVEALKLQTDIARAGLGTFFKVVDEWTFYPLPTSEILDQKEVTDDTNPEKPIKRISYRERRVILDMDKVQDPIYSRLIKKFSDTKNGLSIELYPADVAQERILKVAGRFKDAGPTVNINMSWKDFVNGADNPKPSTE